jgi:TonB-linked SusC/RagA family outer membrane protein
MKMKKIYKRLSFASVLLFLITLTAMAQQKVVTGRVADGTGNPMPGVNVILKGTTTGTSTDVNGNFSIEANETDVLLITFIGFTSEELPVGAQTKFDITLVEDVSTLQEIVVIGYGEQKKVLNTGANFQVKGEDLQKLSTTNVLQALQGQTPGVQIASTSGQPGSGMKVVIRGLGTIGNSGPLYVVDGVLTGDISYLNNADIQSVDVLKDAASAAIYGSQAANGVVLITTKAGKSGRSQITFDAYYGVQNVARKTNLLNAREYASIANEAAVNSGKLPIYSNDSIAAMGEGMNWLDRMFVKNAVTKNYSFGASGGSESSVYSASLSYVGQEGIVGGKDLSNYERYNFRINSEHKLYKDRVVIGENLTFTHIENNGIGVGNQYNNTLRSAFNTTPLLIDSKSDTVGLFNQANPYYQMVYNNQNKNNTQKLLGNIYLQLEPLKGLKFRTSLGVDYYANEGHSFTPEYTLSIYAFNDLTKVNQSMSKGSTMIWDNLLSYGFKLANDHQFDVMAGTSAYQYAGTTISGSNVDLVFNDLEHAWLANATNKDGTRITITGKPENENKRMSYFGRLSYNFQETYLLNATFRADGSSQFSKSNRWGYFPSVSAGIVLSNVAFMESTNDWLDFLKVRVSWGQVGNQNAGNFQYLAPVKFSNTNYSFGPTEGALTSGAYPNRLANPGLKWEISEQTNFGVDARFLNGKFHLTVDWYKKTSKNWLINAPILATAGADSPWINGGNVVNKGIEVALSYDNTVGDFHYRLGVNGAYNKNNVTNIPTEDGIIHGLSNQLFDNSLEFYRAQSGYPIGYFWGLKTNGIFQSEEQIASYTSSEGKRIQEDAQPGDVIYVDRDDNGIIDDKDKTMIGNPNPNFIYGFSVNCDFKGFDLTVQANGVAGNQIVQSYRNQANQYGNYTTAILDRWHGAGSSNTVPRVTENNSNWTSFSDLYVHDGDFLRISNVTLGYDLSKIIRTGFASQFRIYVSALNLFTFTEYNGMDPEIGYGVDNVKDNNTAFSSGIDLGYYPRPRTYMVGVNVKF